MEVRAGGEYFAHVTEENTRRIHAAPLRREALFESEVID
jgi:hypothetical protein